MILKSVWVYESCPKISLVRLRQNVTVDFEVCQIDPPSNLQTKNKLKDRKVKGSEGIYQRIYHLSVESRRLVYRRLHAKNL